MSAIAGIYCLDHQSVPPTYLACMRQQLISHGPDRTGQWQQDGVGLTQCQMIITPEDRYEQQPLIDQSRQIVLVADVRLDNRPELTDALRISASEAATLPDSALILYAYLRWEDDAPKHLIGDYAFALWDGRRQLCLLVRSPMGTCPLYYHHADRFFAFATMPSALWVLPEVPRLLNEENLVRITGMGVVSPAPVVDGKLVGSLYHSISQVTPGHLLTVTPAGLQERPFWQLDLSRRLTYRRDEEYVEAFRELFGRVVKEQVRSIGGVGVAMSGGLDSSAVGATAALELARQGKPLQAFTEIPRPGFTPQLSPKYYADETPLVQALAAMHPNLNLHLVRTDGQSPFADLDRFFAAGQVPFRNVSNRPWIEAINQQAQAQGVRVLLTGERGNITVSWNGANLFADLLGRGKWLHAWRAAAGRVGPMRAWRVLARQGILPLLPTAAYQAVQRLSGVDAVTESSLPFYPDVAASRDTHMLTLHPADRQLRHALLFPFGGLGDYDAAYQATYGLSRRDPTSDIRVIEFCFAVPEEQWQRGEHKRWLIRRAMADRCPPQILENTRRGMQAADWFERLQTASLSAMLARLAADPTARRLLNLPELQRLLDTWPSGGWEDEAVWLPYQRGLLTGLMIGHFLHWFDTGQTRDSCA